MIYHLREYQFECIKAIEQGFDTLDALLVQLPTGSGKTVILWHFLQNNPEPALIIAPTRELIDQLYDTGCEVVGEEHIFLKNTSYWPSTIPRYTIMTNQGATWAMKRGHLTGYKYLIVDEAHRSRASNLEDVIKHCRLQGAELLGLTATPERLDGKSLLEIYDKIVFSKNLIDLIIDDHLCDVECYKIETKQKLKDIKYQQGDLAASALKQLDLNGRNQIIKDVYETRCKGKKTLIFCLSVAHAIKIAGLFSSSGVKAEAIYGALSKSARKDILRRFSEGSIDILCNCQLLTEGFDEPSIECLIIARPTKSKALYCQMVGRGLRPYPGKASCQVFNLSDDIHNIITFNALGTDLGPDFEFGEGEALSDAIRRHSLTYDDVDYEIKEHEFFELLKIDHIPAHKHQKETLLYYNIPFLLDISMTQAAYLIFKHRMLDIHGFDNKAYWDKWRDVSSGCEDQELAL